MKAATAQLSRDATTRLVQTCTGHPISAEALGRMRNPTGIEDKFKDWGKKKKKKNSLMPRKSRFLY